MKKAIFIDRDGTIIAEPPDEQIDSLEKLRFVPGAISGLRALAGKGYELVMVSNQDGLGTESFPEADFWPAHRLMLDTLEGEGVRFDDIIIDRTFPADNAPTRKPGIALMGRYTSGDYDLAASYVIGDRETDMQFARNLGARGMRVEPGHGWVEIVDEILRGDRTACLRRTSAETDIEVSLDLDGTGQSDISTGLHFFDHMLSQIPHHGGVDLRLHCKGDLEVDEHHTMEDTAIVLGKAIAAALGDKRGIDRYGFVLPMDECRAMVLIDLGGRSSFEWDVPFTREYVGDTPTEMYSHFFKSLSDAMQANLHIQARGDNNHHLIEAVFKAFARALRMAVHRRPFDYTLPSSKGLL